MQQIVSDKRMSVKRLLPYYGRFALVFSLFFVKIGSMGIYTCRRCGKQYESNRLTSGICDDCTAEALDKYHQVRDYLWRHPGTTASDIAKACDCNILQVMRWVKEDRFMLSDDSRIALYCEICGRRIVSGRYCEACRAKHEKKEKTEAESARLQQRSASMHGTATDKEKSDDGKMRFLH